MNGLENVKLIAEFMQWNWIINYKSINLLYKEKSVCASPFNHSWAWLMPVVKEIYKTKLTNEDNIYKRDIKKALLLVDNKSLHDAVINFIKYYNQNNNNA